MQITKQLINKTRFTYHAAYGATSNLSISQLLTALLNNTGTINPLTNTKKDRWPSWLWRQVKVYLNQYVCSSERYVSWSRKWRGFKSRSVHSLFVSALALDIIFVVEMCSFGAGLGVDSLGGRPPVELPPGPKPTPLKM